MEKIYRYCQYIDNIDILEEILGYFDLLQYLFLRKKVLLKVLQLEQKVFIGIFIGPMSNVAISNIMEYGHLDQYQYVQYSKYFRYFDTPKPETCVILDVVSAV